MCLLILLRGFHREHPVVVAGNRDERRDRPASPPGLFVGQHHRMLSPRDRQAGGTWLGVDDRGWFAGLTNVAGEPPVVGAPSRGHLVHLALDAADLGAAVDAVRGRVAGMPHAAFQLVLCDGLHTVVVRHVAGRCVAQEWTAPVLVVSNEHAPGELRLRGLDAALVPGLALDHRLERLAAVLRDPGDADHHPVCKRGGTYGTVSSSLLAVPGREARQLVWRYASGSPDVTPYRQYGNLGRRLLPEPE